MPCRSRTLLIIVMRGGKVTKYSRHVLWMLKGENWNPILKDYVNILQPPFSLVVLTGN